MTISTAEWHAHCLKLAARYQDGATYQEIADAVGLTRGTVYYRINRLRRQGFTIQRPTRRRSSARD